MKMRWEEPRIEVQQFMPNEYVAACWGVSCSVEAAHCGMQTNQWVIDDDGNGTVDRMIETGTDGLGDLTCTLYTGLDYKSTASFSGVTTGSYIYWTTTSGDRTWHHQGRVVGTDSSHPNRS